MDISRFLDYDKPHCWQYEVKQQQVGTDFIFNPSISINDLSFHYIPKDCKSGCDEVKEFIEKYEWLGKIQTWTTHRFVAYYQDKIACAVLMSTPNQFSNYFGKGSRDLEKLISRGASAWWTPKNTSSYTIMQSIKWMVHNTDFRIFTAYSDPEAKELGTVYQACNFYYLGQRYGNQRMYLVPDVGWVGSHYFTYRSAYVRYAKKLGIEWEQEWYTKKRKVNWKNIPKDISTLLREEAKTERDKYKSKEVKPKHKYVYILGKTKAETKSLRSKFCERYKVFSYPKVRGL